MVYNKELILNSLSDCSFHNFAENNADDIEYNIKIKNCDFNGGCTKYVIIPEDSDYVIKIPYQGCFSDVLFFNEETKEYYYKTNFEDFIGGVDSIDERPWDYCGVEMNRYKVAAENNLEKYFAKIELIGFINNYPIYIQEKCETYDDCCSTSSKEQRENTKNRLKTIFPNGVKIRNSGWMTDFAITYSFDELVKLITFLHNNDWDEDLHSENIGYLNGKPIIIDYAGYYE